MRCRAKWEWVSEEPTIGEGVYEWVGQGAKRREVVKSLRAVVAEAERS